MNHFTYDTRLSTITQNMIPKTFSVVIVKNVLFFAVNYYGSWWPGSHGLFIQCHRRPA